MALLIFSHCCLTTIILQIHHNEVKGKQKYGDDCLLVNYTKHQLIRVTWKVTQTCPLPSHTLKVYLPGVPVSVHSPGNPCCLDLLLFQYIKTTL